MLRSGFARAEDSPGLLLYRVTNAWQAEQRAALKPFELTHVQFVLLASLAWLAGEEPVTQRALAQHAGTDPMMTSQVLRALADKGLLTREPHPHDSRARALRVTERGVELANAANTAVEAADARFFAPLSTRQEAFTGMLRTLSRSH